VTRRLLSVEDTFMIAGRGLLVVPLLSITECPRKLLVRLERPDGSTEECDAWIGPEFISPPRPPRSVLLLYRISKADVPHGTVVVALESDAAGGHT
jgi:hypothetical protein